ncbi:MAG: HAMP domain-containing protein [Minisyncoccia bacterium]
MKIAHKLYLVIAISLITIIGLGVVSYSGVKNINNQFDALVEFPIPSILRLSSMTETFLLSVEEAHSYRLYGEIADKQGYYANAREFDRLMTELKKELRYGTPDILQEDTDLIDSIWKKVDEINRKIVDDFMVYEQGGGTNELIDPFSKEKDEVVVLLRQYRDMEKDEIENARNEVNLVTAEVTGVIVVTSLFLLLVILAVNGLLARSITRPLSALDEAVKKLGEGDLNNRVKVYGKDELGVLATAFNTMADNVQQSHFSLEAKIQERTAELERARVGLEHILAERTSELRQVQSGASESSAKKLL